RVVVEHRTATMNEVRTDLTWRISISMIAPILIGEVCYNLRSALDYLIHELTNIDTGPPKHKTQFPIEDGKNGFLDEEHMAQRPQRTPCGSNRAVAALQWTRLDENPPRSLQPGQAPRNHASQR